MASRCCQSCGEGGLRGRGGCWVFGEERLYIWFWKDVDVLLGLEFRFCVALFSSHAGLGDKAALYLEFGLWAKGCDQLGVPGVWGA